MFDLIRDHQLNIMLMMCGMCGILVLLVLHTRFLPDIRKKLLILMESMAMFLLWFDRLAYIYKGDVSSTGRFMVRLSNFLVFFLTSGVVFGFTHYLMDLLKSDGKMKKMPTRLVISAAASLLGMILAVVAAFTDLYYYFDEMNVYHRGKGFFISYIIPVICPLLQLTVIMQYRKKFSRLIYISLVLYIIVPICCALIQVFTYGISLVNMAMAVVSISLYMFNYLDINDTVEHAHEIEIQNMEGEKKRMQRLFDQTATAFISASEKKDDFIRGNAVKTAEYAERIAALAGKDEAECKNVYYAALLHDVGIIGIPDSVIKNSRDPEEHDRELMKQKPLIGNEILSCITEYPYLSVAAHYSHERYNGTGYPDGLKGDEIPEIARIVAVADAYVTMTARKRFRDARPDFIAREAFVKGAGVEFDPVFANLMIKIIDHDSSDKMQKDLSEVEKELVCNEYREKISIGIPIGRELKRITFECETAGGGHKFSAPAIILFDSYNKRVHDNTKSIEAYHYLEYCEVWFDENSITTAARKIAVTDLRRKKAADPSDSSGKYEIVMGRYDDHLKLKMKSPYIEKEITVALPNGVKSAYLGLTGEHCILKYITVRQTEQIVKENDIPRIADKISYTDHLESDLKNLQINTTRSDATCGIEIVNRLRLVFHTMSLPGADLIWHCPYVIIFSSDDGKVGGENYREYALVKLNGENEYDDALAHNSITMKKTSDFHSWEFWKENNLRGLECDVLIERKEGRHIVLKTENLGVSVENKTDIIGTPDKVYVSLTGDQVALTDIRVIR